ncbi:hypothetical protein V6N13_018590 [Hibiscus sabdariffa]
MERKKKFDLVLHDSICLLETSMWSLAFPMPGARFSYACSWWGKFVVCIADETRNRNGERGELGIFKKFHHSTAPIDDPMQRSEIGLLA